MKMRMLTYCTLLCLIGFAGESQAALVNVNFAAGFSLAGNPDFDTIFRGTTVSGSFSYQTQTTGSSSLGVYMDAPTNFSMLVNGVTAEGAGTLAYTAPAGDITVVNSSASGSDEFRLNVDQSTGLTGDALPLGKGDVVRIYLTLEDTDATVFDNANTPEALLLSAFENATIDLSNFQGNAIFELTSLHGMVVPLPATAWLFGSALLGLGVVKRRKA